MSNVLSFAGHVNLAELYFAGLELYRNGGPQRGQSTGWPGVDELYSVGMGQLTVVTGTPNSLRVLTIISSRSVATFVPPPFAKARPDYGRGMRVAGTTGLTACQAARVRAPDSGPASLLAVFNPH